MIVLIPLRKFQFPIMAECINPSVFQGKTAAEIAAMNVWEGNKQKNLGDLFSIEEDKAETPSIRIDGDASEVRRIGVGMKEGEIAINGNAGMHLGEKMTGGKITITGDAGGWVGSQMKAGTIEIHGNAGPFLGCRMRDGVIHVEKNAGPRLGASMLGGKIIVSGLLEEMMPTFTIDSVKPKVKVDDTESVSGPFYVFLGDLADKGVGKLFVSKTNNPHLSRYERFI